MSHQHGAWLGGLRNVQDLRKRCRIDPACGCWVAVGLDGREYRKSAPKLMLHVHGLGQISATQAAYVLRHGKKAPPHLLVYRTCSTADCVNPWHMKAGTRRAMRQLREQLGAMTRSVPPAPEIVYRPETVQQFVQRVPPSVWALGALA